MSLASAQAGGATASDVCSTFEQEAQIGTVQSLHTVREPMLHEEHSRSYGQHTISTSPSELSKGMYADHIFKSWVTSSTQAVPDTSLLYTYFSLYFSMPKI